MLARWSGFAVDLFVFTELLPGVWLFALYPAKKEYNIGVIGWRMGKPITPRRRAEQIGLRGDKNTPGPAGTAGGTVTKSKIMPGAAPRDFARESP